MDDGERERLNRLSLWLALRRETDEILAGLTRHGPAASTQIDQHLGAITELLAQESQAFSAVRTGALHVPQQALRRFEAPRASVHSMDRARDRRDQT